MNPETPYKLAVSAIDALAEATDQHHAQVAEISGNGDLSEAKRQELLTEARTRFHATLPETARKVGAKLDRSDQLAAAALNGDGTDRASARVLRLLDAGKSPAEVAELCAETGDVDGYRALRAETAAWVTTQVKPGNAAERKQRTAEHLLAVDRAMAGALTGDLASAARVRLGIDEQRARLDAIQQYAINPSAMTRLTRAFAFN